MESIKQSLEHQKKQYDKGSNVSSAIRKLWSYCSDRNFSGYDPHDALNSPVLRLSGKLPRQLAIQFLKRSPINFRSLFGIPKGENPKGLGLFLSAATKLYKMIGDDVYKSTAYKLAEKLALLRSEGYSSYCWGYNFDWQSRAFFLPKYTPTIVATTFIANSFIEAAQVFGDDEFLKIGISAAGFVAGDLNRSNLDDSICFSYSPKDKSCVHNANMLGAAFLAKVSNLADNDEYMELAYRSAEFSLRYQNPDGSWYYGVSPSQNWIDNFHTGYMIDTLSEYIRYSNRWELENSLNRAIDFYVNNLFTIDGVPKYYPNKLFPIDIHSCSQAIITLSDLSRKSASFQGLLEKCVNWILENMVDARGYFYFQKHKFYINKIPYMRWGQAWMLKALVEYYWYLLKTGKISGAENISDGYSIIFGEEGFSFEKVER